MDNAPAQKPQRSPWFYVLIGCGGFALLSCLGVLGIFAFGAKKVSDMGKGITDPQVRAENARELLGTIPEGYYPAASFSFFGIMDMAMLVDSPPLADGGFEGQGERAFMYFRLMAMENNKKTRTFFTSDSKDASSLRQSGINIDASSILKRGSMTVGERKLYYVATRGTVGNAQQGGVQREGINNAILFDCPGEQLYIGVWTMQDQNPDVAADALDLTGTVADEAEVARFVKPLNPCGK